jgi:hypothetical protein
VTAPVPSLVQVPQVSGTPQASIDNLQLVTSAGTVQRQVTTPADPINPSNYQFFDAYGNAQVKFGPALAGLLTAAPINFNASGQQALVAGVTGKIIRVYRLWLTVSAQTNLEFQDGSTPLSGSAPCGSNGGITLDFTGEPWYVGSANNAFNLNSSNPVQCGGTVYYVQS